MRLMTKLHEKTILSKRDLATQLSTREFDVKIALGRRWGNVSCSFKCRVATTDIRSCSESWSSYKHLLGYGRDDNLG